MSYRLQLLLRSFIICLIAVFIAAIPQDLSAREREVRYLPLNVTIDIFSTGHIHGHIIDWDYAIPQTSEIGLAKVNTIVKNGRLNNKYNLLLDAGSFQYGSAMTAHYADTGFNGIHPMIRASNYMFYDGLILGETDFSQGTKALADAISKSNAPILAANVYDSKTGKLWNRVEPYIIKTFEIGEKAKAKIKIGIIGVTDKASLPEGENFSELNITDQVEAVKKYTKELQKKKVDAVIVVTHSGLSLRAGDNNPVIAIAQNCPGVNLIISSHRFAVIDELNPIVDRDINIVYERARVNGVPIISSAQNGAYVGKATLTFEMFGRKYWLKSASTSNITTAGVRPDRELSDATWPYHDSTLQAQTRVIGYAASDFESADVASRNMAAIDLLNKVQLNYSNAQLSAANLFNLDPKLKEGPITIQDIKSFYPPDNTYIYAVEISGGQLKHYLEHAARYFKTFKEGDRVVLVGGDKNDVTESSYDIVSGVNYTIDITRPVGERVKDITYRGRPVDVNDVFTIAMSSSRYNGQGGYLTAMGFDRNNPPKAVFDSKSAFGSNGQIKELLVQYVREKRTIRPETPTNFKIMTDPFEVVETHF